MTWCASAPHHITSVFIPRRAERLEDTGSIGAGIAVEPRVHACSTRARTTMEFSTLDRVVRLLGKPSLAEEIRVRAPLPPASGYAVSAAVAVAGGIVAARLLGKTILEGLVAAHSAEILESTGLGDVLAISCGVGVVLRYAPGAPGVGRADCIQVPGSVGILTVETGKEHTSGLLSRVDKEFVEKARRALDRIFEERTVESFIEWSQWFSNQSGALMIALSGREVPRVPGLIGLYAKKRVIVFFVEREWTYDAAEALRGSGWEPRLLTASEYGPRLWWEPRWLA